MVQSILIAKIELRELFQIRFYKIEPVTLVEIVDMTDIKEQYQVWSIKFLIRKQDWNKCK